ncbi:MAG: Type 1 glutamine amidotransferase-like domain-containing protein [Actinobacteria bacterium]|nr:Type 1 glutamine amidotransferase-like domain-containing protein [Actinomycetota bacterium]
MKLFLASEAKNPISFKKLEEFVGGFQGKKIAYIPTAANGEKWGSWKDGGSWGLINTLNAKVKLIQLEDYFPPDEQNTKEILKDLEGKDVVWFAGGQPGYLMYWIRRAQLDKNLKSILDKGAIYVGSSAGSMVTAKTLDVTEWYIGENEYGASAIPGLGLVDFDIYPHYREDILDEIKKHFKGDKLYLLKDGEAIMVEDQKVTVFGEEKIVKAL